MMSVAGKQALLHDFEKDIGTILTASSVNNVLRILSEELMSYEVEQISVVDIDMESKEMLRVFLDSKKIEGKSDKTIERLMTVNRII